VDGWQVALGSREEEVCLDVQQDEAGTPMDWNVAHGYGHPSAHNLSAIALAAPAAAADGVGGTAAGAGGCNRTALRRTGSDLVPRDVEVGAVRVSVTGWEGWVMEGLRVRGLYGLRLQLPSYLCVSQQASFHQRCTM